MMEKLDLISKDNLKENIEKLAELFPNCITESFDDNGDLKKSVDFDLLKQELSPEIVDAYQERYTLNWPGKREAILRANSPISKTLRPVRKDSVDFDNTKNLFIEGDNEEALKLLQENYLGAVKMIYIDPPYNTGKDFIYPDDFAESRDEYLEKSNQVDEEGNRMIANTDANGRFHSDWLSMMYSRLKLARNLLRDDGVIFISIDDNEVHNLRKICDEIFGAGNFVINISYKNKAGAGAATKGFISVHEYVLCYAKNYNSIYSLKVPLSEESKKLYSKKDEKFNQRGPFGTWALATSSMENRPNLQFPIIHEGETILPNKQWLWSKNRVEEAMSNNELVFNKKKDGSWSVRFKQYLKDEDGNVRKGTPTSIFMGPYTHEGTKDLKELLMERLFSFSKPVNFINSLIDCEVNNNSSKGDIILDFFAGSATTAHAVMQLNAEDGGNRKFILVQLPEECDEKSEAYKAGYKTIAEISKERIRRAGKKIKEDNPETAKDLDIGFRVLKVDNSNMKDTYYKPSEIGKEMLSSLISNIKEDRTDEDLLFQVMLDTGIQLDLEIKTETIHNKKVFFVAGNSLCACFENELSEEIFTELAKRKPLRLVLKDSSFKNNDALKTNVKQILKQLSAETDLKVI